MNRLELPVFDNRKELQAFLFKNKASLYAQKKAITKHGDGIGGSSILFSNKKGADKADPVDVSGIDEIYVKAIINTTNIIDSHLDLHLPGIWNKTVKENKNMLHVQEHKSNQFDKIISDGSDLEALVVTYKWSELGYSFKGETEALQFNSNVLRSRNEYMFNQYAKGYVRNHSVGMRYVKYVMCIDNKDYGAEYEAWGKYIEMAVNPEVAENAGHFWAVGEAKAIEGSAVPLGSNWITPTLSTEIKEPSYDTLNIEAEKSLQRKLIINHLSV